MSVDARNVIELNKCADVLNVAIITALSTYAGNALELGFRGVAVEYLAQSVAITERMDIAGRADTAPGMMKLADMLEADGIRADVFTRASQLVRAG
jgi:hypothetical protein